MNIDRKVEIYVRNKQGIVVFKIINGKPLVMRLPDMDEYTKNEILDYYVQHNGENVERIRKFLNFEDENGENEFCS